MIITRKEALIISKQILEQAERERLLLVEEEAKRGVQYKDFQYKNFQYKNFQYKNGMVT